MRSRGLRLFQPEPMGGKALEDPLAAGQDNDLEFRGRAGQDREHLLDAPIVREHERVVEDDHGGTTLIREQLGEGEAGQHGDLLARTFAQPLERLDRAAPGDRGDAERLVDLEIGAGKERFQVGPNPAHQRPDVALLGVTLGVLQYAEQQLQRLDVAPMLGALLLQFVGAPPGAREALVQAAAREHLNALLEPLDGDLALLQCFGAAIHGLAQLNDAPLEILDRFPRRLFVQLAQALLGESDLTAQLRAAGGKIDLGRRTLGFAQLGAEPLEMPCRPLAAGQRLRPHAILPVAGLERLVQLAPRRAQLRQQAIDLLLRLAESGLGCRRLRP